VTGQVHPYLALLKCTTVVVTGEDVDVTCAWCLSCSSNVLCVNIGDAEATCSAVLVIVIMNCIGKRG